VLELSVGIAYESDTKVAIATIKKKLAGIECLSQTRSVQIGIDSFGYSSINLEIRCSVETEQLYEVKFSSNQLGLESLKEASVQISFHREKFECWADLRIGSDLSLSRLLNSRGES